MGKGGGGKGGVHAPRICGLSSASTANFETDVGLQVDVQHPRCFETEAPDGIKKRNSVVGELRFFIPSGAAVSTDGFVYCSSAGQIFGVYLPPPPGAQDSGPARRVGALLDARHRKSDLAR